MPKSTHLVSIYDRLRENATPASLDHFLFLFGTKCKFIPNPTAPERSYPRGETFSFAAQVIASMLEEAEIHREKDTGDPLSFATPSVQTLDGPPSIWGYEVYDRIARCLLLALLAAASGKKKLHFFGFSRGGVIAILVLHELIRIKEMLKNNKDKPLLTILIKSPCKKTGDALKTLFPEEKEVQDNPSLNEALLERLNQLNINGFFIDPVPGFNWNDTRFCLKLPCDQYELLVAEDERSQFFYPIIPRVNDTVRDFIPMPGHHGTMPGNIYDQALKDLDPIALGDHTKSVQDLVICKLFYFLGKVSPEFNRRHENEIVLNTGHEALDKTLTQYRQAPKAKILEHYFIVAKHLESFRYFRKTSYPGLLRTAAPGDYRYVYLSDKETSSIASVLPEVQKDFVNTDHVKFYFDEYFHAAQTNIFKLPTVRLKALDSSDTAQSKTSELLSITALLDNLMSEMKLPIRHQEEQVGDVVEQHKLRDLLSEKPTRTLFFNGVSTLLETASQHYLHDQFSYDEKTDLMLLIKAPFNTLSKGQADKALKEEDKEILNELKKILQNSLKQTIEAHFTTTMQQSREISKKLRLFMSPDKVSEKFDAYLDKLTIEDELDPFLKNIITKLQEHNPQSSEAVQEAFAETLENLDGNAKLNTEQKEKIYAALFCEPYCELETFIAIKAGTIERYLSEIKCLNKKIEWLDKNCSSLEELMGTSEIMRRHGYAHSTHSFFYNSLGSERKKDVVQPSNTSLPSINTSSLVT